MGRRVVFRWARRMTATQLRVAMVSMFELLGNERVLVMERDVERKRALELGQRVINLSEERDDARARVAWHKERTATLESVIVELRTTLDNERAKHTRTERDSRAHLDHVLEDNDALNAQVVQLREQQVAERVRDLEAQVVMLTEQLGDDEQAREVHAATLDALTAKGAALDDARAAAERNRRDFERTLAALCALSDCFVTMLNAAR